jgi:hypothetical protein
MNTEKSSAVLTPRFCEWAAKHGTPIEVIFPKRGGVVRKRRFFVSEEAANTAISEWKHGTVSVGLGKRKVDEMLYCESMLPPGVGLRDCVHFYLEHHSGSNTTTILDVAKLYLTDLKRQQKAEDYQDEMKRTVESAVVALEGATIDDEKLKDTGKLFSTLNRAMLLRFIKSGETYWVRYARKRAVSVLISKAREMEAIKFNPLDGWVFEDAPKKTPHFLKNWEADAILNYANRHKPELVTPFALQLFAGIRTEELCRNVTDTKRPLWWSDLKFGQSITIPVEVSKTNDRRVIDYWPEALSNWIVNPGEGAVPVCSYAELDDAKSKLIKALNKERKRLELPKVDFKQNDFRRTYATNSVAVFGGEKTKDRLGHQEPSKVLKKHYDGLTEKAIAEAYYQSKPEPLIAKAA